MTQIVPFGAGSSVEGNFTTPHSGISIDFSQMNKIIALHEDECVSPRWLEGIKLIFGSMDVVVQPGVNWVDLNEKIKESGLFLPMDPSPTVRVPFAY